mmetsp:Transcript_63287/g.125140  ORF Transcript_63287/g.125140 Transcript_63287/m.125140 type:complete len:83 (-) Transcript_63287:292-540(-)
MLACVEREHLGDFPKNWALCKIVMAGGEEQGQVPVISSFQERHIKCFALGGEVHQKGSIVTTAPQNQRISWGHTQDGLTAAE